jgi:hypothetical protein
MTDNDTPPRRRMIAWLTPEAFDAIEDFCVRFGIDRTVMLEGFGRWVASKGDDLNPSPAMQAVIDEARRLQAERKLRRKD